MARHIFASHIPFVSIRMRITLGILSLVMVIAAWIVFWFPRLYERRATFGLQQKADSLLRLMGSTIAPSVAFDDREHAQEILAGASEDGDLRFVALYKEDGSLIAAWTNQSAHPIARLAWQEKPHTQQRDEQITVQLPIVSASGVRASLLGSFSTAAIRKEAQANRRDTLLAAATIVVLAGFFAQHLGTRMRSRIDRIVHTAQKVAAGDLQHTHRVDPKHDEIGALSQAFAAMLEGQQFLVNQIKATAQQIKEMSGEIVSRARQQEHGASEQSRAVDQTRQTMDSLLQSGRQISQSAQLVLQNAEKTQHHNLLLAEHIGALSTHTQRITEILEVIKDIANKSELLALNAALEGSRAEDAGRGFSLVATQMQRLAEKIMGAVRDIKGLTGDIREATQSSVLSTEDGTRLATDTTKSARQISLIIQQQQTGTEHVSRAMDEVAQIAQQTARGSKQALDMTNALTDLSKQLENLVNHFAVGTLSPRN